MNVADLLIAALKNPSPAARVETLRILALVEEPQALPALRSLAGSETDPDALNSAPVSVVMRAKIVLRVAGGAGYTRAVGRRSGDAVARLVRRFNREGVEALTARHGWLKQALSAILATLPAPSLPLDPSAHRAV